MTQMIVSLSINMMWMLVMKNLMENNSQLSVPGAGKWTLVDIGTAWGHCFFLLVMIEMGIMIKLRGIKAILALPGVIMMTISIDC